MNRTDPPCLPPPEPAHLHRDPQLAILAALDTTLAAVAAAMDARHDRPTIACWAPDAHDDVRLAAAIVTSARALRELIAEYDIATQTRIVTELFLETSQPSRREQKPVCDGSFDRNAGQSRTCMAIAVVLPTKATTPTAACGHSLTHA